MAIAVPTSQEQALDKEEYRFPDGYVHYFNDNTTRNVNNNPFTFSATKNAMKRASNINNNIVGEKLPFQDFTPEGGTLSTPVPEIDCCIEISDAKIPTVSTTKQLPQQAVGKQDSELEKPTDPHVIVKKNEDAKTVSMTSAFDGIFSSTIDKEKQRENSSANINDVNGGKMATVQDTAKKERIRNIGHSIQWIKCELTAMQNERFLLTEQFEHLFEEIMDLKLRIEMARGEDEQILFEIEEDMYAETRL